MLAGLALALFLAAGLAFDRPTTRWAHPDLVDVHDSPYGRIAVVARGSQLVVFQNDALWFETESVEAEAFVHVAAVQHEAPGRVLVLGGGAAGLVEEVLKHAPSSVDWVEFDAAVARIVLPRLPPPRQESFADARVVATVADPRRFLREAGSYDLILAGAAEPTSGEANRFYTREFFAEAARHLSPGGVLAFRLASTEPYWSLPVARRARSIRDALASAFPDVLVLPGAPNVFLAANGRLVRNATTLASRLEERRVSARLVSPAYLRYVYDPERVADLRARFEAVRAPVNTDGRPVCYQYTAIIWLSQFYPRLATLGGPLDAEPLHRPLAWALALAGLATLLLRRHAGLRSAAFVATAGFTGMVLETILLLHYQLKNGVVFQDIGLLLTAVMIGLAGGAFAVDRAARRAEGDRRLSVWWAVGIAVLAVGVALATAWTVHARPEIGLPWALALLALTGAVVSMAFGYAGLRPGLDRGRLAWRLYAADLAGAAAGTLAATLILVPLAGLAASAAWIAALATILFLLA